MGLGTEMTHQACSSNGIGKGLGVGGTTAHMEGHPHHLYVQLLGSGQQASTVLHEGAILVAQLTAGLCCTDTSQEEDV